MLREQAPASTTPDDVLVELRDLSFSYPRQRGQDAATPTIADLSLQLWRGEFVCLVGPSGCGKSTLLRILAGLERPTQPESVQRHSLGRRVGMIFQTPSVFPWLTVHDNVAYGIQRSVPRDEREARVHTWIERMGLTAYTRRRGFELSGGMAQRVAIARALAAEAELLLCDEPFAAVDEPTRILLQGELIEAWQATNATVVFVTHSIQESIVLADRIALLSARPASIRSILAPPFGRPRDPFALQQEPGYSDLSVRLWDMLREEMLQQRAEQ